MAVLSRLLLATNFQKLFHINGLSQKLLPKNNTCIFQNQNGSRRLMSEHHVMEITPTRWQWQKTKDWLHFYFLLGAIPVVSIITYANVFIGPATLEPIPEGYVPEAWEYHKNPITRFLAKYVISNPQMEYEKYISRTHTQGIKRLMNILQRKVETNIRQHADYKYWTYKRGSSKAVIDIRKRMDADNMSV